MNTYINLDIHIPAPKEYDKNRCLACKNQIIILHHRKGYPVQIVRKINKQLATFLWALSKVAELTIFLYQ